MQPSWTTPINHGKLQPVADCRLFQASASMRRPCIDPRPLHPVPSHMIVIIDNYDSFTYNLVQRLGEIDPTLELQVVRNDQITVDELFERRPHRVIISPGPCTPTEAGISVETCQRLKGRLPLLG